MSLKEEIRNFLFRHQDLPYAEFHRKLVPTVNPDTIIGVRTPVLRAFAKDLAKRDNISDFILDLPHDYFEENQLHVFILSLYKDVKALMPFVEAFLPYIDNWATCDVFSPKVFRKHLTTLFEYIRRWITSNHPYTVRFAIGMLMEHFLEDAFKIDYPDMVAALRSDEYYVNMMIAWYFATALAKQYDAIVPFIQEKRLATWTHNKAIQKAVESRRISPEQKVYLKSLKV